MIYNNLFDNFIALFPDDKMWFDNECNKKEVSNEDGMHIVFGLVVVPYLLDIAYKSDEKLQLAITIGPLYSQQIQTIQYSFMEDTPLIIDVSQQQYVIAIASSPVDDVVNVEMLCDGVIIPITKIEYIE